MFDLTFLSVFSRKYAEKSITLPNIVKFLINSFKFFKFQMIFFKLNYFK